MPTSHLSKTRRSLTPAGIAGQLARRVREKAGVTKKVEISDCGSFATVELTRGMVTQIDVADVPLVTRHNWSAKPRCSGIWYAGSVIDGKNVYLHRFLLGLTSRNVVTDHRDGDGLNNRRTNLRACTPSQNCANTLNFRGRRGVQKRGDNGRFRAYINLHGSRTYLGTYSSEAEADAVYRAAAEKVFGEYAAHLCRDIPALQAAPPPPPVTGEMVRAMDDTLDFAMRHSESEAA